MRLLDPQSTGERQKEEEKELGREGWRQSERVKQRQAGRERERERVCVCERETESEIDVV